MPKSRTVVGISRQKEAAVNKTDRIRSSNYLITINSNVSFRSMDDPGFQSMVNRLTALGDFMLEKKRIRSYLDFVNDPAFPLTRAQHLEKIVSFDPERKAVVEWSPHTKMLHLHIVLLIRHRTKVKLSRPEVLKIASTLLRLPAESLHVNFTVDVNNFYDYINKNVNQIEPLVT